jgi:hypothetical protein
LNYSQNPADNLYFGKMNNKYMVYQKPLLKNPKNWRAISIKEVKKDSLNRSNLTIHYSRTFKGDTVSISKNNEYVTLQFREYEDDLPIGYISELVTNKEWLLFRKYVQDSTFRNLLSEELGYAEWTHPYIQDILEKSEWINNLDWSKKIKLKKEYRNFIFPMFTYLLLWDSRRYNELNKINENRLIYKYLKGNEFSKKINNWVIDVQKHLHSDTNMHNLLIYNNNRFVEQNISLVRDSLSWITQYTNQLNGVEEVIVNYYNWHEYFSDYPVVGLNSPQAEAYLAWLEYHHNQYLLRINRRFIVHYQLMPCYSEIDIKKPNIVVDSFDLSHWKITYNEYAKFVEYVRDSTFRMELGKYLPKYYKTLKIDTEATEMSTEFWNLNYKKTIKKDHLTRYLKDTTITNDTNLWYNYFKLNTIEIALANTTKIESYRSNGVHSYKKMSKNKSFPVYEKFILSEHNDHLFIPKDLDLSYYNQLGQSTDILGHKNYVDLHSNTSTTIARFDKEYYQKINSKELITLLTYEQFQSYWHWRIKNRKYALKSENPVIQNYIPTEEEFVEIQNGRFCYHSEEQHKLPTPTFRYIVTFQEY